MNIDTPYRGTIRRMPDEATQHDLVIELPLLFTGIDTGPEGLHDVVLVSLRIGDVEYELSRDLTLHALDHVLKEGETRPTIAGDLIRKRPVSFQADQKGNNAIVAVLHATPESPGRIAVPENGRVPIVAGLHLLFTNMATLPLEVRGEARSGAGVVTLERPPRRTTSPVLTNTNLLVLGAVCGLLLLWNLWWNGDVYEQKPYERQLVPALLGSLVTFLGLSVGRIKGWLATLVSTASVLRFPELHFDPTLTRNLSTAWSSAGVGLLALASLGLVGWQWSLDPPEHQNIALYDTDLERVVENERVYRRSLRGNPHRFGWVCVGDDGKPAEDPYVLGYYRGTRPTAADHVRFGIVERNLFGAEPEMERSQEPTGEAWLTNDQFEGPLPDLMRRILCGPALSAPRTFEDPTGPNDWIVKPIELGKSMHRRFEVSQEWIWEPSDLMEGPIADARKRFPDFGYSQLFDERAELLDEIDQTFKSFFASRDDRARSRVPTSVAIALSTALLEEAFEDGDRNRPVQKRTMERALLIRSLWRASDTRQERDATDAELEGVAWTVRHLLSSDLGGKLDRVLFELLLELQLKNEGSLKLHRAAVAPWASKSIEDRVAKVYDYLVCVLEMEAVADPQIEYFRDEWKALGFDARSLGDLLELRNRNRPDPTVDFSRLRTRLVDLENRIRASEVSWTPPEDAAVASGEPSTARTP